MLNKSSQALILALSVIAAPAFAQDAAAPAEATQPATSAPETTAAPQAPATGEAATAADAATASQDNATPAAPADDGAPKAGSYYVKSTKQDWTVRCVKAQQGKDPCELYQLMKDQNDNSVAEITVIPLKNGDVAAGATLVAPLETDLIEGLGFAVDDGKSRGYPFSFCASVGCVSRMGLTDAELTALKRGNKAVVSLLPFGADPKKPVQLTLSLTGFTAAFDELTDYASTPATSNGAAPAETESAPSGN